MVETISIITLALLVLGQLIERHIYSKEMNKRLSEAMKAVMSRNINEFLTATAENNKTPFVQPESDEVEISELSDKEFDKHIKEVVK